MRDEFLSLFEAELGALYERAESMAARYPERNFALGEGRLADADLSMRLLLEGVAYLSARVQDRVERSDFRLALRVLSVVFPRILEAFPPRMLGKLSARGNLALGRRGVAATECSALPEGDSRGRFALAPIWGQILAPVSRVAVETFWLGRGRGVQFELTLQLDGEGSQQLTTDLTFASVEASAERFTELSFRVAAALLCSGEVVVEVDGISSSGRFVPAWWLQSNLDSRTRSEMREMMDALHWSEAGAVVSLRLDRPLNVPAGAEVKIRALFRMGDESLAADSKRIVLIANIAAFKNSYVVNTERFLGDSRRANSYFAARQGKGTSDTLVLRALDAKAFVPQTNKQVPTSFASICGHQMLDRRADTVVVHEPAWVLGDHAAIDARFADRVMLLDGTSEKKRIPGPVDISLQLEVCDQGLSKTVRAGCAIQALIGADLAEGQVFGIVENEIPNPVVRKALGQLLELGLPSFATIVEANRGDLSNYCERLIDLLAPASSSLRAGWFKGTKEVRAESAIFLDVVDGVSVALRGWRLEVRQAPEFLRSGVGVVIAAIVYRFLASRCPINTRLELHVADQEGNRWATMTV